MWRNPYTSCLSLCNTSFIQGTGVVRPGFGGIIDADPITPGIQSTPGVVTPVGPPTVLPGGYGGPVGIGGPVGFGRPIGGPIGGFGTSFVGGRPGFGYDADPISPGIQTRPGVITATGPTMVGGAPFRRF